SSRHARHNARTSTNLSRLCTLISSSSSFSPLLSLFFFYCYGAHRALHSFPTRRSSDLRLCLRPSPTRARAPRVFETARQGCARRSEEHTSELQSLRHLVCRLLLEKKKRASGTTSASRRSWRRR